MDSGAFSAYTLGESIGLKAYCAWLKNHQRYIAHYAVLDDITSPARTMNNQRAMEGEGLAPVPCFHYGEDPGWLKRYLDKYDYLALGGMVPISTEQLVPWLDDLWGNYLTTADGRPRVRVHGFGLTTFSLIERYPWYSVDSSSWLYGGKAGFCFFWRPTGDVARVIVAENSPKVKDPSHFDNLPLVQKNELAKRIVTAGFSVNGVRKKYWDRNVFNARCFADYFAANHCESFTSRSGDLLGAAMVPRIQGGLSLGPTEIYFAGEVGLREEEGLRLMAANRMFSYHYLKHRPTRTFSYVKTALDGKTLPPVPKDEMPDDPSSLESA